MRVGTLLLTSIIGLSVAGLPATSFAQYCTGREYSSSADFAEGQLFNVENADDKLEIATAPDPLFPYVNVACSARGTVVRIFVGSVALPTPHVVGEYWTFPSPDHATDNLTHGDPSRDIRGQHTYSKPAS